MALTVTKLDGMLPFGPWLTAGHFKTGRDDSVTAVPIGRKLMIIAKRGNPAREIQSLGSSCKVVVNILRKRRTKRLKESVNLFVTNPGALTNQPALWAHTVVTFSTSMSLVVGFAGKSSADKQRRAQLLNYFATGMEREKRSYLMGSFSDKAMLNKLQTLKKERTALYELLECLQHDSKPVQVAKVKNVFITKKMMLNFTRCGKRFEQNMTTEKGKLFLSQLKNSANCIQGIVVLPLMERINTRTTPGKLLRKINGELTLYMHTTDIKQMSITLLSLCLESTKNRAT